MAGCILCYNTVTCAKGFGKFSEILAGLLDQIRARIWINEATD